MSVENIVIVTIVGILVSAAISAYILPKKD